jgi:hypothetical protein
MRGLRLDRTRNGEFAAFVPENGKSRSSAALEMTFSCGNEIWWRGHEPGKYRGSVTEATH